MRGTVRSQTIPSFLAEALCVLTASDTKPGDTYIDNDHALTSSLNTFLIQISSQNLVLSISEYPSWPNFFQHIQKRQIGHLIGQFRTGLKQVTIKGPIHGALLEHLRGSFAGKHIGLSNIPPCRGCRKKWAVLPFEHRGSGTNGTLYCAAMFATEQAWS